VPLLAGAALAAVVVFPVWRQYAALQDDPYFRRSPDPQFTTTVRDLFVPASTSRLRTVTSVFDGLQPRNAERQLFPGLVILPFTVVGAVALVRRRPRSRSRARREAGLLVALGVVMLLLSAGDRGWLVGWDAPGPYRLLRTLVPPLAGVRATSRFAVLFQLAVAVLGAVGLAELGRRLPRRVYLGAGIVVLALVLAESSIHVPTTTVPEATASTAVNYALAERPAGVVAELPMVALEYGAAWAFVESPRQFLARIDGLPRVNGYSGFEPHGFFSEVNTLNTFPGPDSIKLLGDLHVRYVVIRDSLVGELGAPTAAAVEAARPHLSIGAFDIERLASTRPNAVLSVTRAGDSWLVELQPGPH
jgi:hypothetical protein